MLKTLDASQGLICYAATSRGDLPLSDLQRMLDEAWQADYQGQLRLTLDEAFLHRLLADPGWIAILICTEAGQPIGFVVGFPHTLYCRQQPLQVYVNTLFTVAAQYRRHGLGRRILHWANQVLLRQYQADGILVAFHLGHAGLPTVQQTHAHSSELTTQVFHTAAIWGKRLDRAPLPPLALPMVAARLGCAGTAMHLAPATPVAATLTSYLPSHATLTTELRQGYDVALGLEQSVLQHYWRTDTLDRGTFWYGFEDDVYCLLSFDMVALQCDGQPAGILGRLQTLHNHHCTSAQLRQALLHLCHLCQRQGCLFVGVLDHGVLPLDVLQGLNFRSTGESRVYLIRGSAAVVAPFAGVKAPYCLDLL